MKKVLVQVDPKVWAEFKAKAVLNNSTMITAINDLLNYYIDNKMELKDAKK